MTSQTSVRPNRSFTSSRGNEVTVYCERNVEHNGMFAGFTRTMRTFARVCNAEVEVEASYKAEQMVHAAGF